jgi:C4-dicarboxylate transporter DctQ subunit
MSNNEPSEEGLASLIRRPLELALCIVLVAIVVVTFMQVLFRYVFQLSLAWTEELARFLFMWLAALAAGYAFKTKSHFALRFVVDRFSKAGQRTTATLVTLLMSLFLLLFTWKAIEYTQSVAGQIGPGTGLSMSIPFSSSVFAGLLMLYYVIRNWLHDIRAEREERRHEVA